MEMAFHRILQFLTLEIVRDLVCRRLTHMQNRLTFQVVRLDLLTHGDPPHYLVRLCFGLRVGEVIGPEESRSCD